MIRQLERHVNWLDAGLDGMTLRSSERYIWIIVKLNRDLSLYSVDGDLDILKVMFLIAQELRVLLSPMSMAIESQIETIESHTVEEVGACCIQLNAFGVSSEYRKLAFCVTYDVLYYWEYAVVKLYMLLRDDVNDVHYYAA